MAEERVLRRLAAIMVADVVGYLTARDANTLEATAEEIRATTGAEVTTVAQDLAELDGADRVISKRLPVIVA